MKKLSWLLRIVGAIQIVLGMFYLFAPGVMLSSMGHSMPGPDIFYPLAMLAARFIAYGIALIYIAREPVQNVLWINFMIMIQLIDLGAGIYYTLSGIVTFSVSGVPMFNAMWIIVLMFLWRPSSRI